MKRSLRTLWVLCFILASCLCWQVWAVTEEPDQEPIADTKASSDKKETISTVEFTHLFPKNPFNILKTDERTELLIGMKNTGNVDQNVVGVFGYLSNPTNFSQILRNLTGYQYQVTIEPGNEATIPFIFFPQTEPMEVGLVVMIQHLDTDQTPKLSVGFEESVTIVGTDSLFDLKSLFLYFLGLASVAGMVYYFFGSTVQPAKKPTKPVMSAAAPVSKETLDEDWIPDHIKAAEKKSKKKQ